jgi:hypothetical protein
VRPAPEVTLTGGKTLTEDRPAATPPPAPTGPRVASRAPVPVIPLVVDRIRQRVQEACGEKAEVAVEVGAYSNVQVRVKVKVTDPAAQRDLIEKVVQVPEVGAPNVVLVIDTAHTLPGDAKRGETKAQ